MTITNLRALRNTLDIEVVKSSCFGNNFLIFDGTDDGILEEVLFSEFSRQVTDPQFGIGADNFIVIQNCAQDELLTINNLRIKFRSHDLEPYSTDKELVLSGHLIFTGEPHLVLLLDDEDSSLNGLADPIFAGSNGNQGAGPLLQRRCGFGTWLVDHTGH